jgi:DNA invertase Pin-like site-specific DNA recombinase
MAGGFVSYLRVSTERQGRSGLGLEAQREAVRRHLNGAEPIAQFVETETGKGSNALEKRPELRAALALARKHKATLVIAKLDRLARNVAFIAQLMEAGVEFVAADMPSANRLTLHIMAAFAEHEREMISQRTKAALAAAKARGAVLGRNGRVLAVRNKAAAVERLAVVSERLRELVGEGASIRQIAATLNAENVPSPGGGKWHPANVHRAIGRLQPA